MRDQLRNAYILNKEEDLRSASSGVNVGHSRSAGTGTGTGIVRCSWPAASRFDAISSFLPELFSYRWQANGKLLW